MRYRLPPDIKPEYLAGRPILMTPQGGKVVLDKTMLALWQFAGGRNLNEVLLDFHPKLASPLTVSAGLACLAEAGLLEREDQPSIGSSDDFEIDPLLSSPQVSAIIVAFNGLNWLPDCLDTLKKQSISCQEIIIVDNASVDGTTEWVRSQHPDVCVLPLQSVIPFAAALNAGAEKAKGDFLLILNQDLRLDKEALRHMLSVAVSPATAAVAANLRLMRTPAFLNGLGNQVRSIGWGTDNFIGYLDLGQFKEIKEVPSVCLAAALINRKAWEQIGSLDEHFPMYYEDTEWSYRARLMGYKVRAAPEAVVYHSFGSQQSSASSEISVTKLKNVVYGRLRFSSKLLAGWPRIGCLISAGLQDILGILSTTIRLKFTMASAYLRGWEMWLKHPVASVNIDQARRTETFALQKDIPYPFIWRGMPELNWEAVCCYYLPLMSSGQTRPIPELSEITGREKYPVSCNWRLYFALLMQAQGSRGVLRKIWRWLRWKLG